MGPPFGRGRPPVGNTSTLPANEAAVSKVFNIPVAAWGNQPSAPTATLTSTAPTATVPLTSATTPVGVGASASTMASAASKKGVAASGGGTNNVARPALQAAPTDDTKTLLG